MKVLIVLALAAMVNSAPVQEAVDGKTAEDMMHAVAKRTDEQIFFGNQQNAPRVKKADPETDSRGLVRALPSDETADGKEVDTVQEEPQQEEIPEPLGPEEVQTEDASPEEGGIVQNQDQNSVDKNTEVPEEDVLKEDQLLKADAAGDSAIKEDISEEGSGDVQDAPSDEMTYDYLQKLYNDADNRMPYHDYYYPEYYLNYRKKRNSGALNTNDDSDVVKRNHRAKRGLGYDDLSDSYFPSTFDADQFYNEVIRKRAVEAALDEAVARELAPLIENYQSEEAAEEYPERYDVPSYLEYLPESRESFEQYPYDLDSWEDEDSFGSLRRPFDTQYRQPYRGEPIKRQMLSMVPGSRRKRFNYPYSQEPGSHWGAFVDSEKRGQEAAYERLYRLARALATRRSPYESYYEDDEYKKK